MPPARSSRQPEPGSSERGADLRDRQPAERLESPGIRCVPALRVLLRCYAAVELAQESTPLRPCATAEPPAALPPRQNHQPWTATVRSLPRRPERPTRERLSASRLSHSLSARARPETTPYARHRGSAVFGSRPLPQ